MGANKRVIIHTARRGKSLDGMCIQSIRISAQTLLTDGVHSLRQCGLDGNSAHPVIKFLRTHFRCPEASCRRVFQAAQDDARLVMGERDRVDSAFKARECNRELNAVASERKKL